MDSRAAGTPGFPGVFTAAFHLRAFPALLGRNLAATWHAWFPPAGASPFAHHVPFELILVPGVCIGLGVVGAQLALAGGATTKSRAVGLVLAGVAAGALAGYAAGLAVGCWLQALGGLLYALRLLAAFGLAVLLLTDAILLAVR